MINKNFMQLKNIIKAFMYYVIALYRHRLEVCMALAKTNTNNEMALVRIHEKS